MNHNENILILKTDTDTCYKNSCLNNTKALMSLKSQRFKKDLLRSLQVKRQFHPKITKIINK